MSVEVRFQNLSFKYPSRTRPALEEIDLTLAPGTLTLVVGASGSGKSTLCYALNGVIPHLIAGELAGHVLVGELDIQQNGVDQLAQQVGLVFQDPETMFTNITVGDEVAFGPANLGWPKDQIVADVQEAIGYVGLAALEDQPVWNLSGGQVQRLALASVLVMRPKVMVLDEPTSNLDPDARSTIYDLVRRLRAEGTTVIVVTKELDELLPTADQLVVLNAGRVAFVGRVRDVLDQHGPELRKLGIWLPEVVELGLALRERSRQQHFHLPLNVDEAMALLSSYEIDPQEFGPSRPDMLSTHSENIITAKGIRFAYPGAPGGRPAVQDVSFEIRAGELVAILGHNGAGKSTLARIMMGLLKPFAGELRIASVDVARTVPQLLAREIAFVFQNPEHQFVTDTVYDELAYGLIANRVQEPELSQRVERMMTLMDLDDVGRDHPFSLSAGKKRRLGVATMLMGHPKILVVDEPTYGQDRAMTESLMEIMLRLQQAGTTILMITHDMRLVETYLPRSIVMAHGQLTFDGATSALFLEDDTLAQASLRTTTLHDLIGRLRRQGQYLPAGCTQVSKLLDVLVGPSDPVYR